MNWLDEWWFRRCKSDHERLWGRLPPSDAAGWVVYSIELGVQGRR